MPNQPLAEVFGFPIDNQSSEAKRHRKNQLCPFHNKVPNCTKDKANDPLGVCSIFEGESATTITCPIRFREGWLIAEHAATFFFPLGTKWTSLTEVRLNDAHGKSAGNIDIVLASYDHNGRLTDFGSLEVQGVYISGNVRNPFEHYMEDPEGRANFSWLGRKNYPHPDYLSSSRKRLVPQLIFKGGILHAWGKKSAVAITQSFFERLPEMTEVDESQAEVAWFIYDLEHRAQDNVFQLVRKRTAYTRFKETLEKVSQPHPGQVSEFVDLLQHKLDEHLENGSAPDAPTLSDLL